MYVFKIGLIGLLFLIVSLAYGQKDLTNIDTFTMHVMTEVVVTGTKTFKRKTDSPVIVNILDNKTLNNLQVCNLSEGLKVKPAITHNYV